MSARVGIRICTRRWHPMSRQADTQRCTGCVRAVGRSPPNGRCQRSNAEDIEGAAEIIGKRSEAELAADIGETAHQEGALVHPLLDRTERVLDNLATPIEKLRP